MVAVRCGARIQQIKNRTTRDGNAVSKPISNGNCTTSGFLGTPVTAAQKQRACLSQVGRNQLFSTLEFRQAWSKLHKKS